MNMKYSNGIEIKLGDKVKLWEGCYGTVVCSMDTGEYSEEYTEDEWGYLNKGILISSDKAGLIHYVMLNEDLELMERASNAT
jgi:hypothetical protein